MSVSTKPYLLRALYEWCVDHDDVPHIIVQVDERTQVPMEYVDQEHGQIVLNIGQNATKDLLMENDWISFKARFGGVAREIWVPVGNVIGIFGRESGEGMGFVFEPVEQQEAWHLNTENNQSEEVKSESPVFKLVK